MVGVIWRGRAKQCFAVNVNVAVTLAVIVTMVRMVWTRRVIVGDVASVTIPPLRHPVRLHPHM